MNPLVYIHKMITGSGIESFKRYYASYRGFVVDNNDPQKKGRIKIKCPAVYKKEIPEKWVFPKGIMSGNGWGFYAIPQIGDMVWISFENGDPSFPIWEYGHWLDGQVPTKADDPKTKFMFCTPGNQTIEFDDKKKKVIVTDASGNSIEISDKGFQLKKGAVTASLLFEELFTLFESTTVITPLIGPQPFVNIAAYSALKAKFKQFFY